MVEDANLPIGRCFAAGVDLTRHPPRGAAEEPRFLERNQCELSCLQRRNPQRVSGKKLLVSVEERVDALRVTPS